MFSKVEMEFISSNWQLFFALFIGYFLAFVILGLHAIREEKEDFRLSTWIRCKHKEFEMLDGGKGTKCRKCGLTRKANG
jgi:hypothetical protein